MGKPLDSPASFRPIFPTFCLSKIFERIILSRLLFFVESNSILFPRQVDFYPGQSTLSISVSFSVHFGWLQKTQAWLSNGAALAHLDFLPPHDLVIWTDGSLPFPFSTGASGVLANNSLCDSEVTLCSSAGPVCSSFSLLS